MAPSWHHCHRTLQMTSGVLFLRGAKEQEFGCFLMFLVVISVFWFWWILTPWLVGFVNFLAVWLLVFFGLFGFRRFWILWVTQFRVDQCSLTFFWFRRVHYERFNPSDSNNHHLALALPLSLLQQIACKQRFNLQYAYLWCKHPLGYSIHFNTEMHNNNIKKAYTQQSGIKFEEKLPAYIS